MEDMSIFELLTSVNGGVQEVRMRGTMTCGDASFQRPLEQAGDG